MDPTQTPTPPLELPAVVIGGHTFTLKYSLLADFVLDRRGIDTTQIVTVLRSNKPGRNSLVIELFAACVAHNFVELGEKVPTPEEWCLRLGENTLKDIGAKLVLALFPNLQALTADGAKGNGKPAADQEPAVQ